MTRLDLYIPPVHPAAVEAADCLDQLRARLAEKERDLHWALDEVRNWKDEAAQERAGRLDEVADRLAGQVLMAEAIEELSILLPSKERAAILAVIGEDHPRGPGEVVTTYELAHKVVGLLALFLGQPEKDNVLRILYPESEK